MYSGFDSLVSLFAYNPAFLKNTVVYFYHDYLKTHTCNKYICLQGNETEVEVYFSSKQESFI
jgi:hypothetical protein